MIKKIKNTIDENKNSSAMDKAVTASKVFGILNILFGIPGIVLVIGLSYIVSDILGTGTGTASAIAGLTITIPMIISGAGLIKKKKWGRILALAVAWLATAVSLIYILLLVMAYIYGSESGISGLIINTVSVFCADAYPVILIIVLHGKKFRQGIK